MRARKEVCKVGTNYVLLSILPFPPRGLIPSSQLARKKRFFHELVFIKFWDYFVKKIIYYYRFQINCTFLPKSEIFYMPDVKNLYSM